MLPGVGGRPSSTRSLLDIDQILIRNLPQSLLSLNYPYALEYRLTLQCVYSATAPPFRDLATHIDASIPSAEDTSNSIFERHVVPQYPLEESFPPSFITHRLRTPSSSTVHCHTASGTSSTLSLPFRNNRHLPDKDIFAPSEGTNPNVSLEREEGREGGDLKGVGDEMKSKRNGIVEGKAKGKQTGSWIASLAALQKDNVIESPLFIETLNPTWKLDKEDVGFARQFVDKFYLCFALSGLAYPLFTIFIDLRKIQPVGRSIERLPMSYPMRVLLHLHNIYWMPHFSQSTQSACDSVPLSLSDGSSKDLSTPLMPTTVERGFQGSNNNNALATIKRYRRLLSLVHQIQLANKLKNVLKLEILDQLGAISSSRGRHVPSSMGMPSDADKSVQRFLVMGSDTFEGGSGLYGTNRWPKQPLWENDEQPPTTDASVTHDVTPALVERPCVAVDRINNSRMGHCYDSIGASVTQSRGYKMMLQQSRDELTEKHETLVFLRKSYTSHIQLTLKELHSIFQIECITPGEYKILGYSIPSITVLESTDFHVEETVFTALGFVLHLLAMILKYWDISSDYQLIPASSRSSIRVCVGESVLFYPLYYKTHLEKSRFLRGVRLLTHLIEYLLVKKGHPHYDPENLLQNIEYLFEVV